MCDQKLEGGLEDKKISFFLPFGNCNQILKTDMKKLLKKTF